MSWRPTPNSARFQIRRFDASTGDWAPHEFRNLRPGDIYAAFDGNGVQLDPSTAEPADSALVVARVETAPEKNEAAGQGYQIRVTVGLLDELIMGDRH